jgi:hypothetical protein
VAIAGQTTIGILALHWSLHRLHLHRLLIAMICRSESSWQMHFVFGRYFSQKLAPHRRKNPRESYNSSRGHYVALQGPLMTESVKHIDALISFEAVTVME